MICKFYEFRNFYNWNIRFAFFNTFRIDFPREVIRGESLYTNMIIDETTSRPENHCDDVFVYISDTVEPGNCAHNINA